MADSLLENYNPLYDVHLRQYFALPHMQKHLRRMGLIDSNGKMRDGEEAVYARHNMMMDMMLKNREQQLLKLAELQKKLDAAEKVEVYRRIRSGQSPESFRRVKASRSLSRGRPREESGGRRRRYSNSSDDKRMIQKVETTDEADRINEKDPYARLSAKASKYRYLHKLDDRTLVDYQDQLRRELDRLERFRDLSFGVHSVARHPPSSAQSWFFRRRSLPSLTASAPAAALHEPLRSVNSLRGRKVTSSPRRVANDSCPPTVRQRRTSNSANPRLPPIQRKQVSKSAATNVTKSSAKPVRLPPTQPSTRAKSQSKERGSTKASKRDKLPALEAVGVGIGLTAGGIGAAVMARKQSEGKPSPPPAAASSPLASPARTESIHGDDRQLGDEQCTFYEDGQVYRPASNATNGTSDTGGADETNDEYSATQTTEDERERTPEPQTEPEDLPTPRSSEPHHIVERSASPGQEENREIEDLEEEPVHLKEIPPQEAEAEPHHEPEIRGSDEPEGGKSPSPIPASPIASEKENELEEEAHHQIETDGHHDQVVEAHYDEREAEGNPHDEEHHAVHKRVLDENEAPTAESVEEQAEREVFHHVIHREEEPIDDHHVLESQPNVEHQFEQQEEERVITPVEASIAVEEEAAEEHVAHSPVGSGNEEHEHEQEEIHARNFTPVEAEHVEEIHQPTVEYEDTAEPETQRSPSPPADTKRSASPIVEAHRTPSPPVEAARTPSPHQQQHRTPSPPAEAEREPTPTESIHREPSPVKSEDHHVDEQPESPIQPIPINEVVDQAMNQVSEELTRSFYQGAEEDAGPEDTNSPIMMRSHSPVHLEQEVQDSHDARRGSITERQLDDQVLDEDTNIEPYQHQDERALDDREYPEEDLHEHPSMHSESEHPVAGDADEDPEIPPHSPVANDVEEEPIVATHLHELGHQPEEEHRPPSEPLSEHEPVKSASPVIQDRVYSPVEAAISPVGDEQREERLVTPVEDEQVQGAVSESPAPAAATPEPEAHPESPVHDHHAQEAEHGVVQHDDIPVGGHNQEQQEEDTEDQEEAVHPPAGHVDDHVCSILDTQPQGEDELSEQELSERRSPAELHYQPFVNTEEEPEAEHHDLHHSPMSQGEDFHLQSQEALGVPTILETAASEHGHGSEDNLSTDSMIIHQEAVEKEEEHPVGDHETHSDEEAKRSSDENGNTNGEHGEVEQNYPDGTHVYEQEYEDENGGHVHRKVVHSEHEDENGHYYSHHESETTTRLIHAGSKTPGSERPASGSPRMSPTMEQSSL
ncbi:unnamed protein product, partial [Mesorhabditis spiculigera]